MRWGARRQPLGPGVHELGLRPGILQSVLGTGQLLGVDAVLDHGFRVPMEAVLEGDPEPEVAVLGVPEGGVESSRFFKGLPADEHRRRRLDDGRPEAGAEGIRKGGFHPRAGPKGMHGLIHFLKVAVGQRDLRVGVQVGPLAGELGREPCVVGIQEGDELASGLGKACIAGGGGASVQAEADEPDLPGELVLLDEGLAGSIIHDENLQRVESLGQHAGHGLSQVVRPPEDRDHHRDESRLLRMEEAQGVDGRSGAHGAPKRNLLACWSLGGSSMVGEQSVMVSGSSVTNLASCHRHPQRSKMGILFPFPSTHRSSGPPPSE